MDVDGWFGKARDSGIEVAAMIEGVNRGYGANSSVTSRLPEDRERASLKRNWIPRKATLAADSTSDSDEENEK